MSKTLVMLEEEREECMVMETKETEMRDKELEKDKDVREKEPATEVREEEEKLKEPGKEPEKEKEPENDMSKMRCMLHVHAWNTVHFPSRTDSKKNFYFYIL